MRGFALNACMLLAAVDLLAEPLNEFRDLENVSVACVAIAVYAEARGQSEMAQALVAQVVLNRASEDDTCDVIANTEQFPGVARWKLPRNPWHDNPKAWQMAVDVAWRAVLRDLQLPADCAGVQSFRIRASSEPQRECDTEFFAFSATTGAQ